VSEGVDVAAFDRLLAAIEYDESLAVRRERNRKYLDGLFPEEALTPAGLEWKAKMLSVYDDTGAEEENHGDRA